jgi:transcriptional regulator with XRE-family HTH domain
MSDLYLVLRHRLDHMTDWVMIESTVLREARRRLSLSYEAVARQIPVSSKTYERYEKNGRVPRELIDTVAGILELDIQTAKPPPPRVTDTWSVREDFAADVIKRLERIEELLIQALPSTADTRFNH